MGELRNSSEVNQIVAKSLLTKIGASVTIAANGLQAIDAICHQQHTFDLVLMDCEMPEMDGYEATQAIRQWEQKHLRPPLYICALTAHALAEHIARCKAAGMNHHLAKPIELDALQQVLQTAQSNPAPENMNTGKSTV